MPNNEMSLLLATRFSESCFQSIRAVAQWMDDVASSLTIVHMYNPRLTNELDAERQLHSFFAEADRYPQTRRVLLEGSDASQALASHLARNRYDMVVAPSSDRVGLPRPFHTSTRAKLMASTNATVWTMGDRMDHRRFGKPQRVGCLISRRSDSYRPLEMACEYALRTGAALQLMYVVPEVHEGSLRNSLNHNEPLSEAVALADLQRVAAVLPIVPELHVAVGNDSRSILRLLDKSRSDILFAGKQQTLRSRFWKHDIVDFVDGTCCPVVCVDHDRSLPGWGLRKLEHGRQIEERLLATA